MKKVLKYTSWILGIMVLIIALLFCLFTSSPKPSTWVIKQLFKGNQTIQDSIAYAEVSDEVTVINNIRYPSVHADNTLDIYFPTGKTHLPVLFWLHGGGFVGGDNVGLREFATYLAAKAQIAVILIDYEKSPDLHYPGQVLQTGQAIEFILGRQANYPMFNLSAIAFGGDSAGGQIAGQYTLVQTNRDYAKALDIQRQPIKDSVKCFISYCSPLNLKQMKDVKLESRFMKFFVGTVSWAWLGKKDWKTSKELLQASLVDHLTAEFPASFITDGNTFSFADQGIMFHNRLKELSVNSEALFYEDSSEQVNHEYQFNYQTAQAQDCLEKTVTFLDKYLKAGQEQ